MSEAPLTGTAQAIVAAAERLLAGKPMVSPSFALTATNLAAEAGISRATMNRHPGVRDSFQAAAAGLMAHRGATHPVVVAELLRVELKATKMKHVQDTAELRQLVGAYANRIQVLTLLLEQRQAGSNKVTRLKLRRTPPP